MAATSNIIRVPMGGGGATPVWQLMSYQPRRRAAIIVNSPSGGAIYIAPDRGALNGAPGVNSVGIVLSAGTNYTLSGIDVGDIVKMDWFYTGTSGTIEVIEWLDDPVTEVSEDDRLGRLLREAERRADELIMQGVSRIVPNVQIVSVVDEIKVLGKLRNQVCRKRMGRMRNAKSI